MDAPPSSHAGLGRFLEDGDIRVCWYGGLGTLTNLFEAVTGWGASSR